MAITWYTSAGQPSDSTGADGDLNWDTTNRITWGPKGKVTSGSWSGTAYSNIGPTGPAQLSGTGAPGSGLGQIGNGYCDVASGLTYLKSSSGWTQTGSIIGPQGNIGATLMTALGTSPGPSTAFNGVTLSSTAYVVPYPGTTIAAQFSPNSSSALMGVYAYASTAVTLSLYNVTTSTTLYSASIAANATIGNQNFSATQYPMASGQVFQWQVTGSGSTNFQMMPFYLMPANSNAPVIGNAGPAGYSASTSFSTTSVKVPVFGSAQGANTWAYCPPRTGGLYSAQATYTPTGSTTSSSSVQLVLNYGKITDGTGGAVSVSIASCTATGLPQTIIAPRISDQTTTFTTGNFFYWTVTGSGTGTLTVNLFPII